MMCQLSMTCTLQLATYIITAYTVLHQQCAREGQLELAAKQVTARLRLLNHLPTDKAFFDAGRLPHMLLVHNTCAVCDCCSMQRLHLAIGLLSLPGLQSIHEPVTPV